MATLPSSLALTSIPTLSEILSADHRNNYTAIQTAVNALISALSGGTAGQVLTATSGSTVAYGPTYSTYTPTWTSSGTAVAIGTSTVVARYLQIGKFVHCWGQITFAGATFGTGQYLFALPVTAVQATLTSGTLHGFDASSGNMLIASGALANTSQMAGYYGATYLGTTTLVGAAAPWTWANSDVIGWNLIYEAA